MDLPKITLVLGGQRSGKSRYAEKLIEAVGGGVYLATAQAFDDEMTERIGLHQSRRGDLWVTHEEPLGISNYIENEAESARPILIDCLTLWLTNQVLAENDTKDAIDALKVALAKSPAPVVLVSNEVGQGVIPDNALARKFVDCAGRMNQVLASTADRVVFLTAGIPQIIKDE